MSRQTRIPPAISPAQCRAGRGLLNWSRADLAKASGVPHRTIDGFELGFHKPQSATAERIIAALEAAGVELIAPTGDAGGGARLMEPEDLAPRPRTSAPTEMVPA